MAYKVINTFYDTTTSHHYKKGDTYPAEGLSLNAYRVALLMGKHVKYKRAFIEEVKKPALKNTTTRKTTAKQQIKKKSDK